MQTFKTPGFSISLSEEGAPNKIQLFRYGKFHHPTYGEFEINKKLLEEMKANFDSDVRGIGIAVDYKHENEAESAAWIKQVEVDDSGMFALVDWTPKGKQKVSDKEYRYISPEFVLSYQDNETLKDHGPTLMGAALTNRPFIKRMEPVVELSEGSAPVQPDDKNKKIKTSEGGYQMTPEEMKAKIEELEAALAKAHGESAAMAAEKQKYAEEKKLAEKKAKFAAMLSEGKVVVAQEEPYLKDDMVKFAELAQPVKLSTEGTSQKGKEEDGSDVDDKIMKLAEEKLASKKVKNLSEGISMVLTENPELKKEKYA